MGRALPEFLRASMGGVLLESATRDRIDPRMDLIRREVLSGVECREETRTGVKEGVAAGVRGLGVRGVHCTNLPPTRNLGELRRTTSVLFGFALQ